MAALFNHKNPDEKHIEDSHLNTELFDESQLLHTLIDYEEKGTGLGLLICHEFVRNNGLIFTETNIKK